MEEELKIDFHSCFPGKRFVLKILMNFTVFEDFLLILFIRIVLSCDKTFIKRYESAIVFLDIS